MSDYERIAKVIRHIDADFAQQPTLSELAAVAGLSEAHFHRMFVKWAGVTPKDFVRALTMDHASLLLKRGESVLGASLDSGLSGPSRLHDLCVSIHAATPGEIKANGKGIEIRWGLSESPFGNIFIANSARGITHLSFFDVDEADSIDALQADWPCADLVRDDILVRRLVGEIFRTEASPPQSPLHLHVKGTPFQLLVWKALLGIPDASLSTYGRLAKGIGREKSSRAVGNAVGRNRISYLIPCHRVIRETGVSGGYRWGQLRKRAMICREQAQAFTPR